MHAIMATGAAITAITRNTHTTKKSLDMLVVVARNEKFLIYLSKAIHFRAAMNHVFIRA
jgi:hypothetical protein